MISLKEKIFTYIMIFLLLYMLVAIVAIVDGKSAMPLSWLYDGLTDENLSLVQAYKNDFERGLELAKERSYEIARELEENER